MATLRVDILVAGLGPAGARAAAAAASSGKSVLAVDRKSHPGYPVQCAEFVPAMLCQEMQGLDMVTHQTIERMITLVEDEGPDEKNDFPGRMIDRKLFDTALVQKAMRAGADCQFGLGLKSLSQEGVAHLMDGTVVKAAVIIGADGPRSEVGRAIGKVNQSLVETRQITVPLLQRHDATDIFLSAEIRGGYGWLFPKGELANLGLGVIAESKHDLKPLLDNIRETLISEKRIGSDVFGYTGGLIPVGGLVGTHGALGDASVLLAGDAAGMTNPITGAGISAAAISGRLAGEAASALIDGVEAAVEDYTDEITDLYGPALQRAYLRRTQILKRYENQSEPTGADIRKSWIAYPEYWAA